MMIINEFNSFTTPIFQLKIDQLLGLEQLQCLPRQTNMTFKDDQLVYFNKVEF
jgi:hypothetical protein